MLVSLKELMKAASEGGYAVGAFNVSNLESLMAIMEAAEETGHGVILNYAEVPRSVFVHGTGGCDHAGRSQKRKRAGVCPPGSRIFHGSLHPGDPPGIYVCNAGCFRGRL